MGLDVFADGAEVKVSFSQCPFLTKCTISHLPWSTAYFKSRTESFLSLVGLNLNSRQNYPQRVFVSDPTDVSH